MAGSSDSGKGPAKAWGGAATAVKRAGLRFSLGLSALLFHERSEGSSLLWFEVVGSHLLWFLVCEGIYGGNIILKREIICILALVEFVRRFGFEGRGRGFAHETMHLLTYKHGVLFRTP